MLPEKQTLAGEEQELFMKTNFESLSAADADKFFGTSHSLADAQCSRLSISTQFLSKSLELVACVCVCTVCDPKSFMPLLLLSALHQSSQTDGSATGATHCGHVCPSAKTGGNDSHGGN